MARPALWICVLSMLAACHLSEAHEEAQEPAGTAALEAPAAAAGVRIVRMTAQPGRYAFDPDRVRVRGGEVVRFVQTDHQPESVAFDTVGVTPEAAAFLTEHGWHLGPLLTEPGGFYDVDFRGAPAGEYPFRSVPHGELGMRGVVIVER